MIKRYNRISLGLGIPGIVLQVAGQIAAQLSGNATVVAAGKLVTLFGTALLIAGLSYYAIAKGRSGWWGLCGFLSLIGLIILACLKDEAPSGQESRRRTEPRTPEGENVLRAIERKRLDSAGETGQRGGAG